MTTLVMVLKNDSIVQKRFLGSVDVTFHGKFYIEIQGHSYSLKHPPIYAKNKNQIILLCAELKEEESVNSYGDLDCILVSDPKKIEKYTSEELKRYLRYDWEYSPYIECDNDELLFFIESSEISEETKNLIPDEAGLAMTAYLKETGNKSIWKDGSPVYRVD